MIQEKDDDKYWNNSFQFSPSVVFGSLQLRGLQHTRLPCPLPIPGAYSNSCPSRRWCHPTISSSWQRVRHDMRHDNHLLLPSVFPSIRVFSSESVLRIRWPKYWSFSFSISPSNEYSGPISFRIDKLDLSVQGTGCDRLFSNFFQLYLLFFKIPLDGALFIYSYPYSVQFSSVILD